MLMYLRKKRSLWVICTVFFLCALPVWAMAQGEGGTAVDTTAVIQRLNIQVMPEFDDSRVLVIVQGRLDGDTANLPQTITLRLPRNAQINQMAVVNMETGKPVSQPFDVKPDPVDARWSLVTYSVNSAHFFYEYYFDPLGANTEKRFTFALSTLHPITELVLEVQQPRAAADFVTEPASDSQRVDPVYGLSLHQFAAEALPAGGETAVTIQYTKTDPAPSVPREKTTETAVPTEDALLSIWVFGLLAVIVVSVIAGFTWYRTRQPQTSSITHTNYCPQCGTPQRKGSRYCHNCGTVQ